MYPAALVPSKPICYDQSSIQMYGSFHHVHFLHCHPHGQYYLLSRVVSPKLSQSSRPTYTWSWAGFIAPMDTYIDNTNFSLLPFAPHALPPSVVARGKQGLVNSCPESGLKPDGRTRVRWPNCLSWLLHPSLYLLHRFLRACVDVA